MPKRARPEDSSIAREPPAPDSSPVRDRSWPALIWYRVVQKSALSLFAPFCQLRATGRDNVPSQGGALLVSNHLSHLDVFVIGLSLRRPLNYVARSTLFVPFVGPFIRSVGGFAIQREGMGAQGLKETLRRLRRGGLVTLFPEGTRTRDGELAPLKAGFAAIAGTFEAWPRNHILPHPHPIHVHYGTPIPPEQIANLDPDTLTSLLRSRLLECQ
ncbi:MAG TPA: lysophospholipid acyltransferase family protein, partial [Isosphaeraceae bacterium]|nr:lysophospholipid acyltransferase family protein [Isosphaeraceae bacterium]